jgi:hypothetical protein
LVHRYYNPHASVVSSFGNRKDDVGKLTPDKRDEVTGKPLDMSEGKSVSGSLIYKELATRNAVCCLMTTKIEWCKDIFVTVDH